MNASKAKTPSIDIGIASNERTKIVHGLSALLADSYTLYLMRTTSTGTLPGRVSTACTRCSWVNTRNSGMRLT